MPIYEYRCEDCHQIFDEWQKNFEEVQRDCPVCGGSARRIVSNTSFVLKGGGWYVTEYGNRKTETAGSAAHDTTNTAPSGTASADTSAGTSSDSAAGSAASSGTSAGTTPGSTTSACAKAAPAAPAAPQQASAASAQ